MMSHKSWKIYRESESYNTSCWLWIFECQYVKIVAENYGIERKTAELNCPRHFRNVLTLKCI